MSIRSLIHRVFTFVLPVSITLSFYLYLYPAFHSCAFPIPHATPTSSFLRTLSRHTGYHFPLNDFELAPFRLLTLADPQLEGDSSLPDPEDAFFPKLSRYWAEIVAGGQSATGRVTTVRRTAKEVIQNDIPLSFAATRKRVDLFGNDYYLAHIYRTLHWWTHPTHVTVLGDLIGSQWVTDEEFAWRGWRYWNRVFKNGTRVEDEITGPGTEAGGEVGEKLEGDNEYLGPSTTSWSRRIINVAGNHDIGYAGDITPDRISRFERIFGRVNWDTRFRYPPPTISSNSSSSDDKTSPTLHLITLNSLNLDTPALSSELQGASYDFINSVITSRSQPVEDRTSFTLLLTHLPLHKAAGTCVDAPYFDFHGDEDKDGRYQKGGIKEQNHLSEHVSRQGILEGIFGMSENREAAAGGKGRDGLILTGHDHEGCDVWHYIPSETLKVEQKTDDDTESEGDQANPWRASRWPNANRTDSHTGIREITLRSMMGEFAGNAGLLSAWFDFEAGEWQFEMQTCKLGVQHIWWGIHILDVITLAVGAVWAWMMVLKPSENEHGPSKSESADKTEMKAPSKDTSGSERKKRSRKS